MYTTVTHKLGNQAQPQHKRTVANVSRVKQKSSFILTIIIM
jgi:hypothetical protein